MTLVTTGYLAAPGYVDQLDQELAARGVHVSRTHGFLRISEDPPIQAAWAANTWLDGDYVPAASIRDAVTALRNRQRSWAAYAPFHAGRARLIVEQLPHVSAKPLGIGDLPPAAPLGSFSLITPNLLFAAARCTSPFPNGEAQFVEDREGPPSRAYLKLWEAFARLGRWPRRGDRCLDLGASPGGWTWTLAQLGGEVVAVDKAPLDPSIDALSNVTWRKESAFAIDPADVGVVDWLCSDVIAYPTRTLGLVERWVRSGLARNMVVTIKFQGATDHDIVQAFRAIEGAQVFHAHHNKHELTFAMVSP